LLALTRILSIDYGTKKTGIAVSDPLQIIATGLDTVSTEVLLAYLADYFDREPVGTIVIGEPLHPDGNPAQIHHLVVGLKRKLEKLYPEKEVVFQDERYTSEEAKEIIRHSGVKKKKRRDKNLVDKVSAVLILQDYMESLR
jgi:putative Holliday junction resolvase